MVRARGRRGVEGYSRMHTATFSGDTRLLLKGCLGIQSSIWSQLRMCEEDAAAAKPGDHRRSSRRGKPRPGGFHVGLWVGPRGSPCPGTKRTWCTVVPGPPAPGRDAQEASWVQLTDRGHPLGRPSPTAGASRARPQTSGASLFGLPGQSLTKGHASDHSQGPGGLLSGAPADTAAVCAGVKVWAVGAAREPPVPGRRALASPWPLCPRRADEGVQGSGEGPRLPFAAQISPS